jgi:hypothetical protein
MLLAITPAMWQLRAIWRLIGAAAVNLFTCCFENLLWIVCLSY